MSASSFSSLTKDLNKSRSLLQAGRSIVDSTPCSSFDGGIDTASVGGDADVVSLEDEFAELAKWCSQQPGQSVVEGIPTVKAKEIVNVLEKEENPKEDDEDGSIQPILISSVGTVKQRYRSLQREEEKKEAKKASRLKRNFTEEAKEPVSCISEADEEVAPNTPVVQYDVVLENLSYSKFCTDYQYKTNVITTVKAARREKKSVLLRTGLVGNEDQRRDGRQILKMAFMQTLPPNDFSCIPGIEEVDSAMQMAI